MARTKRKARVNTGGRGSKRCLTTAARESVAVPVITITDPPSMWTLKASLLFRAGEMVWYRDTTGLRLAVIQAPPKNSTYRLLPLGYQTLFQQKDQIVFMNENNLLPFRCRSLPPNGIIPEGKVRFDDLFRDAGTSTKMLELMNLGASKMAAMMISCHTSLWTRQDKEINSYRGCFFGAERIEIGDCLSLRGPLPGQTGTWTNVLEVRKIYTLENHYPGYVICRGSVYELAEGTESSEDFNPETLPAALQHEQDYQRYWTLFDADISVTELCISGRFYPTEQITSLSHEVAVFNDRMDIKEWYVEQKLNRLDSLGASIPENSALSLEPYVIEERSISF
ncbi:hypothetical protein PT974_12202 [Cladobotryum mycophilum]|uniref:Uncharacterized protein n=1 Tax=Cladobotryum mycophilum TaxID=491253 RepID=A0ABR0S8G3_9HYPO